MVEVEALFGRLLAFLKDDEMFDCSLEAMCSIISKYGEVVLKVLSHGQILHAIFA